MTTTRPSTTDAPHRSGRSSDIRTSTVDAAARRPGREAETQKSFLAPTSPVTAADSSEVRTRLVATDGAAQRGSVRPAPTEVVTHVQRLLTAAYERTALARWLVPEQPSRARLLHAWISLCVEAAFDRGQVEMPPGHRVVSVWLSEPTPTAWNRWDRLAKVTAPFANNFVNLHRKLAEAAPSGQSYQRLAFAGAQGGIRGQGWGTLLLRRRLDALDARQVPAYAVALDPNNVRWLTRHGFRAHGPPILLPAHSRPASTVDRRQPPTRLGVTLQPMWRPPAKPRQRAP